MDTTKIAEEVAHDEIGYPLPIDQKDGDPYLASDDSPATITITGSDAKKYVHTKGVIQKRYLRAAKLDPADILQNRIDQAAAAVLDWHGWEANGQPIECTPANVKALLSANHILEQVEAGIVAHARFFKNKRA